MFGRRPNAGQHQDSHIGLWQAWRPATEPQLQRNNQKKLLITLISAQAWNRAAAIKCVPHLLHTLRLNDGSYLRTRVQQKRSEKLTQFRSCPAIQRDAEPLFLAAVETCWQVFAREATGQNLRLSISGDFEVGGQFAGDV